MIATIGRFLCLTNPHRSRRALFVRAKQHNGNPSDRSGASSPCAESQGEISCGGSSVFFEYRASFHGGTAIPQAAAAASSPYTGEPRGVSCGGTAYFSNIGLPFTGERQPLRPKRRPAPLAQGSQGEYTPAIRYKKRGSSGEPLGTLFFDLRQRLFGYCKNTSPHPRRR